MFTVLTNTRKFNLFLIAALAIIMVILLTFAFAPTISDPKPVFVPVSGISEPASDYYQRHPELRINVQDAAIPVTGNSEASDYFQRHPELSTGSMTTPLAESLETPGLACESPVDCR